MCQREGESVKYFERSWLEGELLPPSSTYLEASRVGRRAHALRLCGLCLGHPGTVAHTFPLAAVARSALPAHPALWVWRGGGGRPGPRRGAPLAVGS